MSLGQFFAISRRVLVLACATKALWVCSANPPLDDAYNQWKKALGTNSATAAENLHPLPGFKVELIRSASKGEGSWIALTFDPRGRVIVAREDRGLLRMTLQGSPEAAGPRHVVVTRMETINTNLLECRGLLFAHGDLFANANNSKALVRLRDSDGDDQFDEIKVLRHAPGGVGHGRNQLALGPDGFIYSIHGDDVRLPTNGVAATSPLRNYGEDRLLPCAWDQHLFNADASPPYGHLIRTDADGAVWELMAGGFRNPFGLDFNADGDLFTFDADMEWDIGLPWYHATRVLHIAPGGDYGWRRGTGVLPSYSPDTLASVVDIGASSPTAIKFGTKSRWPAPWKSALFLLDWSYGRIIAVELKKQGATYTGKTNLFLYGRPLNVTGLEFGPDGDMYFVTGGRRTQSGLYRVSWTGRNETNERPLEKERSPESAAPPIADLWTRLDDSNHWTRYAARVELESTPVAEWSAQALGESRPKAALTALLALARTGNPSFQPALARRAVQLSANTLDADEQLLAIRTLAVSFIRMGAPNTNVSRSVLEAWEPRYPAEDPRVRQSLCELLVYLGSARVVEATMPLFDSAPTQEERLHYLMTLRLSTNGWTLPARKTYFAWLQRARREFTGANMLPTALNYLRADAEATLSSTERESLGPILLELDRGISPPPPPAARSFVREWTVDDLLAAGTGEVRDISRGKKLFTEAGCAQCHRIKNEGGFVGPDLTSVSSRFDRHALVESVVVPSKVVAEIYRPATITMKSGAIHDGRIVAEDAVNIVLAINPVDPDQRRTIKKSEVSERRVSDISPMPNGILNTLTRDEALDLLAWIEGQ